MADDVLKDLNPRQCEAVEAVEGPLLIVAGPGSGKTRVITHRIAYLVKKVGVSPYRIVAVTFTNKAAKEMLNRLVGKSQRDDAAPLLHEDGHKVIVSTFHALCASILRRDGEEIGLHSGFVIYDDDDQATLIKRAMEEAELDPKRFPPRSIQDAISGSKAQLIGVEEYIASAVSYYERDVVAQVYRGYQALLTKSNAVDFDDLLLKTYILFRDRPKVAEKYQDRYQYLLIDEFQDTNVVQYAIAKQLSARHRNICVVGDPDQSIYSWRHADIRNILSFQQDFPTCRTVMLEENYRSTQTILAAAQSVIAANKQRVEKNLFTSKERGKPIVVAEAYDQDEEARWVIGEIDRLGKEESFSLKGCAVMYRVNAQSRALEEVCIRHGVPYKLVGAVRFYQRKEVKDILAYLRLLINPSDEVSLARVINVPPRGIGQKTQDELTRLARSAGISPVEAVGKAVAEGGGAIPAGGRGAIARFSALLEELMKASQELHVVELLDKVMDGTGYRSYLLGEQEGEERWENLVELRRAAQEFEEMEPREGVWSFLERVSLVSDVDNLDEGKEGVTLITLHQAKGLEFPVVFIVGMEDGLLPHIRSFDDPVEMEEERRLCYVGMTRAQERLYLVRAFRRNMAGSGGVSEPSRFLMDIPQRLLVSPGGLLRPSTYPAVRAPVVPAVPELPKPDLKSGDRVRHTKFGEGMVVSCKATSGDYEVTVAFQDGVVKRLLYSYASLEKVER